jgi:hypothetical protein
MIYFWVDDVVIAITNIEEGLRDEFTNCYCYDENAWHPLDKTGYYNNSSIYDWIHKPLSEFPAEFKLQLLLLGVTL